VLPNRPDGKPVKSNLIAVFDGLRDGILTEREQF
jgi:hypothetical protein